MGNDHRRWRLILNGKSAGDDALRAAVAAMRARGIALDVRVTWEAGDAERHVSAAIADGVDAIVAAGGDGTLSEVATALAHRDEAADALPALGLVPLGTANDFAVAAALPLEPLQALALVAERPATRIDLIRLQGDGDTHWAANFASGGFGTQVTADTPEGMKHLLGGLAYFITGVARLGRIDALRLRLSGPGFDWAGACVALGIGNGRQAGGGHALCPDARIDDGLLDVVVIPELDGELAATFGALLAGGRDAALERVAVRARLADLEVASDDPLQLNLDGEPVASRRFRIACAPGRVRMHLPADCPLLG